MRSSMSCHSRPGHRALYVSTTSSVFTCTLIEATVTPASCQHQEKRLSGSSSLCRCHCRMSMLLQVSTRCFPLIKSSSSPPEEIQELLLSLSRLCQSVHSPPQFHLGPQNPKGHYSIK